VPPFGWRHRSSGVGAPQVTQENVIPMKLLRCLFAVWLLLLPSFEAEAQEHSRIKWKRPTQAEADHMAAETAITDSILRKGDIVVTDHGFLMFRGYLADGTTGDFVPVPNPMSNAKNDVRISGPSKPEKGKPTPMGPR